MMNDRNRHTPRRPELVPTADQTFEIRGGDFVRRLADSRRAEHAGDVERACEMRFESFRRIAALLPDDEETILEWNDPNTRAAVETLHATAVDHFLIDDFEMSAGVCELLLEIDPEDHCEATILAAQSYAALGEFDSFDAVLADIPEGAAVRAVLTLFVSYCRDGVLNEDDIADLRRRHPQYYAEFTAAEHPADEAYLNDIESANPSMAAQARELWLRTENLWRRHPDFVQALSKAGTAI